MTIFFHAKTAGFYDTRAHGERTLWIADPDWVCPQVSAPDPNWVAPQDDPNASAPSVLVDDPQAKAPLVEVSNPNCHLPPAKDLWELTPSEYLQLFEAQSRGQIIHADGKVPVALDPPPLTWDQRSGVYVAAVQAFLDETAKAAGYEDLKSAISYADEPIVPRFQADGIAFRTWRSLCWAYCYEQLAALKEEQRTVPTSAELIAELPALVLPHE